MIGVLGYKVKSAGAPGDLLIMPFTACYQFGQEVALYFENKNKIQIAQLEKNSFTWGNFLLSHLCPY